MSSQIKIHKVRSGTVPGAGRAVCPCGIGASALLGTWMCSPAWALSGHVLWGFYGGSVTEGGMILLTPFPAPLPSLKNG